MSDFNYPLKYDYKIYTNDFIEKLPDYATTSLRTLYANSTSPVIKPNFDTSNITDMYRMFFGCQNLTTIPHFDTSNVTNMEGMFYTCGMLKFVPHFDTSNVTKMGSMFYSCSNVLTTPHFDTSKVTSMASMFYGCNKLKCVPHFDTSSVTEMANMFYNCQNLATIPEFDTSKAINMNSMFTGCSKLVAIPQLDGSSITSTNNAGIIGYNNISSVTKFDGFINLGKSFPAATSTTLQNLFDRLPNLSKESLLKCLNGLYDRAAAGYTGIITLKMNAAHLSLLTDEEKAIATNKGWILS